jgi:hypothetical protein
MPKRTLQSEGDEYWYVLQQLWVMLRACRAQEYIKFGSMREDRYDALFTRLISGEFDQTGASIFSFGIARDAASRYGYIRWNDRRGSSLHENAKHINIKAEFTYIPKPKIVDHAAERRKQIRSNVKTAVLSILGASAFFGASSLLPGKKPIDPRELESINQTQLENGLSKTSQLRHEIICQNMNVMNSVDHVHEVTKRLYQYDKNRQIHRPPTHYSYFEKNVLTELSRMGLLKNYLP